MDLLPAVWGLGKGFHVTGTLSCLVCLLTIIDCTRCLSALTGKSRRLQAGAIPLSLLFADTFQST